MQSKYVVLLTPLNKVWYRFGIFLGSFISPVVMAIVFFLVITPTGILVRLSGNNLLRLKKEKKIKSYWIKKKHYKTSMKNQF